MESGAIVWSGSDKGRKHVTLRLADDRLAFVVEGSSPPLLDVHTSEISKLRYGWGNTQTRLRLWVHGEKWTIDFPYEGGLDVLESDRLDGLQLKDVGLKPGTIEASLGARDVGRAWMKALGGKR